MSHEYLPEEKIYHYAYNEVVADLLKNEKKIKEGIPKEFTVNQLQKCIINEVIGFFELRKYRVENDL